MSSVSDPWGKIAHKAHAPLKWDPTMHVLSRFSFGPTAADRAWVAKHGVTAWWNHQIALGRKYSGYSASRSVAAQGPLLKMGIAQLRQHFTDIGQPYSWSMMDQLAQVTVGLQAWSPAQLYETVVDFFANHLNVANRSDTVWLTRHTMDHDVIRRYAFGTFTDMLLASAKNPAMLTFLNLAESKKIAINENYGRELLELHTVGRGNYNENDVKNSAKILTGRTVAYDYTYTYHEEDHWVGPIRVMGFHHSNSSASGGEAAGDAYLRYLASHPATAHNLARKLCIRYVSDSPSTKLVNTVANAYLKNKTAILPMLTAIFHSTEFAQSRGAKVRRPAEHLIATIRALGVKPANMAKALQELEWWTNSLGQQPLGWAAPNGYPDVAASWRSSGNLLLNWEFNIGLVGHWWKDFSAVSLASLYGGAKPKTSGQAIDAICRHLIGTTLDARRKAALQGFLGEPGSTPLAKSSMRWFATNIAALVLDSPHHALR